MENRPLAKLYAVEQVTTCIKLHQIALASTLVRNTHLLTLTCVAGTAVNLHGGNVERIAHLQHSLRMVGVKFQIYRLDKLPLLRLGRHQSLCYPPTLLRQWLSSIRRRTNSDTRHRHQYICTNTFHPLQVIIRLTLPSTRVNTPTKITNSSGKSLFKQTKYSNRHNITLCDKIK